MYLKCIMVILDCSYLGIYTNLIACLNGIITDNDSLFLYIY